MTPSTAKNATSSCDDPSKTRLTKALSFYLVDKKTNRLASPEFSTLDEAKQFAAIFSMTSYAGYILRGSTYFFNVERDEQGKRPALPILLNQSHLSFSIIAGVKGSNSSIRLFGQVGNFSRVSFNHSSGFKPFSLAVPSKV